MHTQGGQNNTSTLPNFKYILFQISCMKCFVFIMYDIVLLVRPNHHSQCGDTNHKNTIIFISISLLQVAENGSLGQKEINPLPFNK